MLDVRRLRLLHALSVHGTVTAAAEALHVTSPAVSQQLAALEREAGVALVEREGRRLALTRAGHVLAAHTQLVLDQLAAAEADLASLRTSVSGVVRVGAFVSVAALLPRVIQVLRSAHGSDVELFVHEMEPEASLPALRRGDIDIAVIHSYNIMPRSLPTSCESFELFVEPVNVALPLSDPLVQQDSVDLSVLADRPWIMPRTDASCHELTQRACGAAGFVPRAQAYCDDFGVMCGLVEAGLGVALVPSVARRPGVALRPLTQQVFRTVSAVVRNRADGQPAVRAVLEQLRQV
ncbi:LysR family transcriptional regulator [Lentzea flaviverrucosa]|uniref:DNA-binding transcriptional regulator, LysR family n=1 Tax=Lentzea flaviverrucosa TaxID=200379 RepID=A0A1H9LL52_9PSEU|nr:LysR family transcriptional regulator [Lentzea flaviverrucosa]RDI31284.1 DNA-binding transcriptional LysR family regulator [Lentzea flaviverrucosa]SER11623.1 DNA-binding transcriptional regulator, LysR family [Lentzea flaviverrucosa]